jgi:hypothetical protein
MSKIDEKIKFEDSTFKVQKYYEETARIALWRMLNIPNIYTLETSFYAYRSSEGRHVYFSPNSYKDLGISVCLGLF